MSAGAGGTVYFSNGTYCYAAPNQVPVLTAAAASAANAAHTDHSAVALAAAAAQQAPPTFPQQASPVTPTAVSVSHASAAPTQVPGTQSAVSAGYPTTLMYPQAVYFPQQFQHYQPQVTISINI